MVCFGAARIHASARIDSSEHLGDAKSFITRTVDFKPNAYLPAAFADWSETGTPDK